MNVQISGLNDGLVSKEKSDNSYCPIIKQDCLEKKCVMWDDNVECIIVFFLLKDIIKFQQNISYHEEKN